MDDETRKRIQKNLEQHGPILTALSTQTHLVEWLQYADGSLSATFSIRVPGKKKRPCKGCGGPVIYRISWEENLMDQLSNKDNWDKLCESCQSRGEEDNTPPSSFSDILKER